MVEGFSQKEMMVRILDKLEAIDCKINATHDQAMTTNGKVKLHTKLIMAIGGALVIITGWIISIVRV